MFSPIRSLSRLEISSDDTPSPVLGWKLEQISNWLDQEGLSQYLPLFENQCITTGPLLLQVTEEHLSQLGISCIGHRLSLINSIDSLRQKCRLLPNAKYVDVNFLLDE